MKLVTLLTVISLLSISCATRTKVFENKKTSPRWVKVANPEEFLNAQESSFIERIK